jgi:Holliday junction resolvase RusA-like endonuclease
MSTLAFTVIGEPKGQPRPRAFARKMGAVHVARFYDSDVADEWKRAVSLQIARELMAVPVQLDPVGAFDVKLTFFFRRPKSHYGKGGHVKPSAPVCHVSKPDADNLAKLVLDQITRSECVWRDDSQVVSLTVHKSWAVANEQGCSVSISTLGI